MRVPLELKIWADNYKPFMSANLGRSQIADREVGIIIYKILKTGRNPYDDSIFIEL